MLQALNAIDLHTGIVFKSPIPFFWNSSMKTIIMSLIPFFQNPQSEEPIEIPNLNSSQYPLPPDSTQPVLLLGWYDTDPQPQLGSLSNPSSNMAIEGDLPEDKGCELNILVASEELVARNLSKMKEGLHAPFEEEEVVLNMEPSKISKLISLKETLLITGTGFEEEDDEENLPLLWKVRRKLVPTSKI